MFSDWVTRFSDICIEFLKKLCKLVKVSKKSSDFVHFNQSTPYLTTLRLWLKSPTGRVTNITLNTCSCILSNSLESIQLLLSCFVVVVCLAEVNLPCFDQVLLFFLEEHRLHYPTPPQISTLASVAMQVTVKNVFPVTPQMQIASCMPCGLMF